MSSYFLSTDIVYSSNPSAQQTTGEYPAASGSYDPQPLGYNYPEPSTPAPEYGPPAVEYGPPAVEYGPPSTPAPYLPPAPAMAYGPPSSVYGPPAPVYGPPAPVYGPPKPIYGPPSYYHPREESLFSKFKFKLDLFTIGKIILKLLFFKKIIKFLGIICLLLFLPKLKGLFEDKKDKEDSSESRSFVGEKGWFFCCML